MCGRYSLTADGKDLWDIIEKSVPKKLRKKLQPQQVALILDTPSRRKFNIVPSSHEPILLVKDGETEILPAHWWLLPAWGGDKVTWRRSKSGAKTFTWKGERKSHFNSRWDTVSNPDNRYWHGLLQSKRCLVPADGFVEWPDDALRPKDQEKIPHFFSLRDRAPYFFAGVFDDVTDDEGQPFPSYNIITVEPNAMLKSLPHHRMPAILTGDAAAIWIEPSTPAAEAAKLLHPVPDAEMTFHPISRLVNSAANESARVLEPLASA